MITYPDKPWTDGQTFEYTTPEGDETLASYNESKNAWTFTRVKQRASDILIEDLVDFIQTNQNEILELRNQVTVLQDKINGEY